MYFSSVIFLLLSLAAASRYKKDYSSSSDEEYEDLKDHLKDLTIVRQSGQNMQQRSSNNNNNNSNSNIRRNSNNNRNGSTNNLYDYVPNPSTVQNQSPRYGQQVIFGCGNNNNNSPSRRSKSLNNEEIRELKRLMDAALNNMDESFKEKRDYVLSKLQENNADPVFVDSLLAKFKESCIEMISIRVDTVASMAKAHLFHNANPNLATQKKSDQAFEDALALRK